VQCQASAAEGEVGYKMQTRFRLIHTIGTISRAYLFVKGLKGIDHPA